ncbi:MAG: peptidase [Gammaproteobacteria bacterium]|nr:peptidase [Gammaproteobacteria bacterium]
MTYCVAINVDQGITFCSDSRTSAGVDQINTYSKMFRFGQDGNRQFVILAAGNLATTQAVIARLDKDMASQTTVNLNTVTDMDEAADYLGRISVEQQNKTGGGRMYEASFLLGGQILGTSPQLMLVYPQGNYIKSSRQTPFLQIGESQYGKPILDRIITTDTDLHTAALCSIVSMDSTMRSNLSVGPPIEIQLYRADSLLAGDYYHLEEDSDYLRQINQIWNQRMLESFASLPALDSALAISQ